MNILIDGIKKLKVICENYNQEFPTEIEMIYNVKKNTLDTKFRYDLVYSNDEYKLSSHIFSEWFNEISS